MLFRSLGAILCFYKIKEFKNWHELYGLKKEHKSLALERELLFKHMKSRKSYNNLLFNGIREGFKNDLLEEKYDSIYLFPIIVRNFSKSKIEITKLEEEIRNFFGYQLYSKEIELRVKSSDIVNTHLTKESFYQLIYSLLNILLDLLQKNSNINLEIKATNYLEINIKHTGVFIDMEKMKLFASKKNHGESLLLNIEELFRSIEINKIDYFTTTKSNMMEISLKEYGHSTDFKEKDEYKVINISDYSK